MATKSASLQKKLDTLKKGLTNKFISTTQKDKIKSQIEKIEKEMKASKPAKTTKSSGARASISKLDKLINKKKFGVYKGAGVDLKKDGERPAKPIGKRKSASGNTYYEYRANRIDVKQPSKKATYPKLAKGGSINMDRHIWEGWTVGNFIEELNIEFRYHPKFKSRDEVKKWAMENQPYYKKYIPEVVDYYWEKNQEKYEKGGYMAKGGEVDRERMYNFLKEDLAALENAIEENNQEEIDKFFSYWNIHLKDLEPKTGSKRMYEFLKDDLVGLEAATKELPSSKEETNRFFSYWNIHLKSLEPVQGGYMAKGGDISVYNLRKGDKVKTRKGDIETIIRKTGSGSYETIESEYTHSPESLEFVSRPGRKMADGGEVMYLAANGTSQTLVTDKSNATPMWIMDAEYYISSNPKNNAMMVAEKIDETLPDRVGKNYIVKITKKNKMADGGYMADGGVTEKEVVESNAQMVLSQIKAVKHHADELSKVVSSKSEIEAWVVGKIERASTDLSDITHYLDGQKDKMSMGGSIRYYTHKMDKK